MNRVLSHGWERRAEAFLYQTAAGQVDITNASIPIIGLIDLTWLILGNFVATGTAAFTVQAQLNDDSWVTVATFTLSDTTQATDPMYRLELLEVNCWKALRYSVDKGVANSTLQIIDISKVKGNQPVVTFDKTVVASAAPGITVLPSNNNLPS